MWKWVLQDAAGNTLSVLTGAENRSLSFKRSSTPEASFDLSVSHNDAYVLQDALAVGDGGMPILRCFRDELQADGTTLSVCRFAGVLLSTDDTASDDAGTMTIAARGSFDVLEGRFTEDVAEWTSTPAGDIALDLLALAEAQAVTGIVTTAASVDASPFTALRDVSYEAYKRISEAMLDVADAFDFEVVPQADVTGQGGTLGEFWIWEAQGEDRPGAIFGYGPDTVDNCVSAARTTQRPRNRVWVQGDEGIVGFAEDTGSQDAYGLWTYVESMSDIDDLSVLDARAQALLEPRPIRIVTFTPQPVSLNTPSPWLDYWLGDTVRADIRKGAMQYSGSPRIESIQITLDDEGNEESHTLAFADNETA